MSSSFLPAVINILTGIIFIAISIPLLKRKIKMNDLFGVRIPKAFESEENWYNINAYGAKQLITWGIFIILIGIIFLLIPVNGIMNLIIAVVPMTISVLIAIIKTLNYAKKL